MIAVNTAKHQQHEKIAPRREHTMPGKSGSSHMCKPCVWEWHDDKIHYFYFYSLPVPFLQHGFPCCLIACSVPDLHFTFTSSTQKKDTDWWWWFQRTSGGSCPTLPRNSLFNAGIYPRFKTSWNKRLFVCTFKHQFQWIRQSGSEKHLTRDLLFLSLTQTLPVFIIIRNTFTELKLGHFYTAFMFWQT